MDQSTVALLMAAKAAQELLQRQRRDVEASVVLGNLSAAIWLVEKSIVRYEAS